MKEIYRHVFLVTALKSAFNIRFYIGLMDITGSRDWHWISDNSSLTYTNWGTGQPENNTKACVFVNIKPNLGNAPGEWSVTSCLTSFRIICESERVSVSA